MKCKDHKSRSRKGRNAPRKTDRFTAFRLSNAISQKLPYELLFSYVRQMPGGSVLLKELNYEQSIEDWAVSDNKYLDSALGDFTSLTAFIKTEKVACYESDNVTGYRLAYQAEKLLSKFPRKGGNADVQRANAINRFYEAEDMCRETNNRFKGCGHDFEDSDMKPTIDLVREFIRKILGPLDRLELIKGNRAGPGLTFDQGLRKMGETTPFFKYHDRLTATACARYYTAGMISLDHHWMTTTLTREGYAGRHLIATVNDEAEALKHAVVEVPGNRITFVPKDTTTDRTIAIEPSGNIMLQLGVGNYVKTRLKRWGINLKSQKKNQKLALLGSILDGSEELATIDLSMASDTLSFEVVKHLLPREWFIYLSELRSPSGTLKKPDGIETVLYEKFSSMGNGYTFELESLIFFAITLASYCVEKGSLKHYQRTISVFGDDIVCPSEISPRVIKGLEFFGFKVNEDKSFIRGKFKESCGKDYFLGEDVRPFFLKRQVRTLQDLHFVSNSIAHKSMEHKTFIHEAAYDILFHCIPANLRLPGPLHFSVKLDWDSSSSTINDSLESCLRVPWDWALENGYYRHDPNTFGCFYTEILVQAPKRTKVYREHHPDTCELACYHTFLQGVRKGDITLRGLTRNVVKNRVSTNWWVPKQNEPFEKATFDVFDSKSRSTYHPLDTLQYR